MSCKNMVIQNVPTGYSFKMIMSKCGSTGIHGQMLLCDACEEDANKQYPQGWHDVPGDVCKHGNYVGNCNGPDYICGQCEDELEDVDYEG